jgi:hypothetical protein
MDTIKGYPIIATFPTASRGCDRGGRIIILDRGETHEERYVVAWQGATCVTVWASHWEMSVYCRDLAVAREMFVARVNKEVL